MSRTGHSLNISGKLPPWARLALWAAFGVALIALKHFVPVKHGSWCETILEVIKDVGIAVVVATVLAATIDRWFSAEIHEEVFEAVIGYLPPPAFKEEIRRLLRYEFVAENHVMRFILEDLDADHVRLTTTIERNRQEHHI